MRTRTNKRWTQREIDYIREKYPTTKRYTIAFDLGVTMQVLDAAIKRHGLRKMPRIKEPRFSDELVALWKVKIYFLKE